MKLDLLAALNAARRARSASVLVRDLDTGEQRLALAADVGADPLGPLLAERLALGRSGLVEQGGRRLFLNVHTPPRRLVLTGAGHIAQALAPMARLIDFDVTIVDPRAAFATPERFPGARLLVEWPQDAAPELALDRFTAVAALAHDPRIDDPALVAALGAGCFYVGALGSRKSHARRLERLQAEGVREADAARVHGPVGLDIGAVSPAEIAVSILGEIVLSLRRKPLRGQARA